MAIITTLEVGASGVAHALPLDAAGNPATSNGTPVWSASNADATVTARADGLTADVTRLTANAYSITCTVKNAAGADVVGTAALPMPAGGTGTGGDPVSVQIGFTDV